MRERERGGAPPGAAEAPSGGAARRAEGGAPLPLEYVPHPPTSLPHRDLLILEHLQLGTAERVCEVGVGTGETAVRLARLGVPEVVGLDVSDPAVEAARPFERRYPNLELAAADVTREDEIAPRAGRFDLVFSCDTLEHVPDPDAYFRGVASLLAPGGRSFISFPNEPPEVMHGITRFDTLASLEACARRAGLRYIETGAARLTPQAAKVADAMGWRPLAAVRGAMKVWQRAKRGADASPPAQRFEETRFFRHYELWQRIAPAVNLYWYAVLSLMRRSGPAYEIDWNFRRTPFDDSQVVLRAQKPSL